MATGRVLWCWLLVATWQYLPCFCTTTYSGTTAAQWILYPHLQLSWNQASQFCNSLGGHLPVLNTQIRYHGFNETAVQWRSGTSLNDIWIGLYSPTPNEKPKRWEGDCSPQPDGLSFWADGEPNSLQTNFCVRYKQDNQTLCTWNCNASCSIVCEFDKGSCRSSTMPGSLPNLQTQQLTASTPDSCWQKCMSYPPSNGQECVGAVFFSDTCTAYMNNTLLSRLLITENSSATTMLKECFENDINNISTTNISTNINSSPRPAVDPCSTITTSSSPVVPTSTSTQPQTSSETATTPQSTDSSVDNTGATSTERLTSSTELSQYQPPTTSHTSSSEMTPSTNDDNVDNNSPPNISTNSNSLPQPVVFPFSTITTSSSLVVPTSTSTQPQPSSETATTPQSTDSSVDDTGTTRTERLTSSNELSQYQPPTISDSSQYSSSSEMTPSTNGSERVVCTCIIKLPPNVSMAIPAMHRNTTSRYRRSHNSEWGSPSVYTSTSSATFVIVVGVAGCLLVVCDFNRFAGVCGKGRSPRQRDKVSHP